VEHFLNRIDAQETRDDNQGGVLYHQLKEFDSELLLFPIFGMLLPVGFFEPGIGPVSDSHNFWNLRNDELIAEDFRENFLPISPFLALSSDQSRPHNISQKNFIRPVMFFFSQSLIFRH
jgi:hypothetical protein